MFALPIIGPWLFKKGIKGATAAVIQGGVLIFLGLLLFLAYNSVKGHFDHIRDIEAQNEQLKADKVKLTAQRDQAIELNKENVRTLALDKEIQYGKEQIAGEERAAAAARAQTYKEISNAIQHTPTSSQPRSTQPVAPVITNTLDSLWGSDSR